MKLVLSDPQNTYVKVKDLKQGDTFVYNNVRMMFIKTIIIHNQDVFNTVTADGRLHYIPEQTNVRKTKDEWIAKDA